MQQTDDIHNIFFNFSMILTLSDTLLRHTRNHAERHAGCSWLAELLPIWHGKAKCSCIGVKSSCIGVECRRIWIESRHDCESLPQGSQAEFPQTRNSLTVCELNNHLLEIAAQFHDASAHDLHPCTCLDGKGACKHCKGRAPFFQMEMAHIYLYRASPNQQCTVL